MSYEDEMWGIFETDRWGFEELYDGPFRTMDEAQREVDRLVNRDGIDSWAADLYVTMYSPEDMKPGW